MKDQKTADQKTASGSRRREPDRNWARVVAIAAKAKREDRVVASSAIKPLKRLGVTPEQLARAPEITSILRLADGGIKQCLAAMRLARGDEAISRFLQKYDSLSAYDKVHLPIEAVCIAAGVDCVALLGSTTLALQDQGAAMIKILASSSHLKIVQARLRFGQLPFGERDRTALDTALGLLPNPRGAMFIQKATIFGSGKNVMDEQGAGGDNDAMDNDDLDRMFPPPNLTQEKLIPIRNRLPDGKTRIN